MQPITASRPWFKGLGQTETNEDYIQSGIAGWARSPTEYKPCPPLSEH